MKIEDVRECFREATNCVKDANKELAEGKDVQVLDNISNLIMTLTNTFLQVKQLEETDRRITPVSAIGAVQ